MNGEPILRPEFDLYVRMSAEAGRKTSEAIESIAESHKEAIKESRETNQILREYIIHNNNKHDKTSEEVIAIEKKINDIEEAMKASAQVVSWGQAVKKGVAVLSVAALTAAGGYYGLKIVSKPEQKTQKEQLKP